MTFWYNEAAQQLNLGNLDMNNDALEVSLIQSSPSPTPTPDRDDTGLAAYKALYQLNVTGGDTDISVTTAPTKVSIGSRTIFTPTTITWNNVAAGNTIGYALLGRPVGDLMVLIWTLTPTATTGGDVQLTFDASNGNATLRTT